MTTLTQGTDVRPHLDGQQLLVSHLLKDILQLALRDLPNRVKWLLRAKKGVMGLGYNKDSLRSIWKTTSRYQAMNRWR